jgi:diamine N-acetyltransferase
VPPTVPPVGWLFIQADAAARRDSTQASGVMTHLVRVAKVTDAAELSRIAAITFPLACAKGTPQGDISSYIASELTIARFEEHIACPTKSILVALVNSRVCGYLMLCQEEAPADLEAQRPLELRRVYVLPEQQGSGVADDLIVRALEEAASGGHDSLWLSVSGDNQRALGLYQRHGFVVVGTCYFPLGNVVYEGFLMSRSLTHDDTTKAIPA